eukprot:6296634-Prymnesium_polylepis.1
MRVAVLGTRRNVTIRVSGRLRSSPSITAALKRCSRPRIASLAFQLRATIAHTTNPTVAAAKGVSGQNEMTSRRLRYDPKQAPGTRKSTPKSAGSSMRLIHLVYSSRPGGVVTLKTLGTAATHW